MCINVDWIDFNLDQLFIPSEKRLVKMALIDDSVHDIFSYLKIVNRSFEKWYIATVYLDGFQSICQCLNIIPSEKRLMEMVLINDGAQEIFGMQK